MKEKTIKSKKLFSFTADYNFINIIDLSIKKKNLFINKFEKSFLIKSIILFRLDYRYYEELFTKNNIKIYISWNKFNSKNIVINKVLDDLGGIFVIWERSFEAILSPFLTFEADSIFVINPHNFKINNETNSKTKYIFKSGFMRGYTEKYNDKETDELRNKLYSKGAKKIIAFFDQTSADDKNSMLKSEDYSNIFQLVLANKEIGFIMKPKKLLDMNLIKKIIY